MAILFLAYYGATNSQAIVGSGVGSGRTTGLKNALGMTDTTSINGNTDSIVFWGLENWWGSRLEFLDNVTRNYNVWTVTEDDGTTRTFSSATGSSNIFPSKLIIGDNLDMIAKPGQTGGSDSLGYCDCQLITNESSKVASRSWFYNHSEGGIVAIYSNMSNIIQDSDIATRLAFTGTIQITE